MSQDLDPTLVWNLAAALIVGTLVGVERERSKARAGNVGIGGVRTFILFAMSGAVASWLAQALASPWIFVVTVAVVGALVIAGYLVQARAKPEAIGLTTEAAAIGVCLLGGACASGHAPVALALGVAVSAVLAYKEPMHGLVAKLGPDDISAGVKLLAATFIVLPLLPKQAIDPWGAIRPQSLWTLVVLIAALSLVGYVATRVLGSERGTTLTGLTGGLVSSTAITLAFARRSREEEGSTNDALAAGLLIAWAVMAARIVVIAGIVHAPLVLPLLPPVGLMMGVILASVALLWRRTRHQQPAVAGQVALRNPFSLTSAVKFGLLFSVVLVFVALVERHFPDQGYYVVAALAGTTDVDAITLSMAGLARDGGTDATTAAGAVVVAALANTLVKCGMILALASRNLRVKIVPVTAAILAAGVFALVAR